MVPDWKRFSGGKQRFRLTRVVETSSYLVAARVKSINFLGIGRLLILRGCVEQKVDEMMRKESRLKIVPKVRGRVIRFVRCGIMGPPAEAYLHHRLITSDNREQCQPPWKVKHTHHLPSTILLFSFPLFSHPSSTIDSLSLSLLPTSLQPSFSFSLECIILLRTEHKVKYARRHSPVTILYITHSSL